MWTTGTGLVLSDGFAALGSAAEPPVIGSPVLAARICWRAVSSSFLRWRMGAATLHGPWREEASIQPSKRWKYSSPESALRMIELVLIRRWRSVPERGRKAG